jgi:hypothetical protein
MMEIVTLMERWGILNELKMEGNVFTAFHNDKFGFNFELEFNKKWVKFIDDDGMYWQIGSEKCWK